MQQIPGRKRGACTGAGLLSGLMNLRWPTLEQPVPKGLHIVVWTHMELMENCSPWEELMLEKFVENCLLWDGPHFGAGEEWEELSP